MVTGGSDVGPCIGNIGPVERLGFRGLCFSDGPIGVNRADLVSVFPSGITAAAMWDRELLYQRGLAIGSEFRGKGAHVMLGPSIGPMGRHPLGGRNWEGFGPDPYLSGSSIAATIRGVHEMGVQTCSKHYIGNEQETQRSNSVLNGTNVDAVSANIDDRTLHELYLWPFAEAVKAGTAAVMCSYNRLNSTYSCEQPETLKNILKEELGFRGYVVSDWFATHSTAPAANAGLDLEMPGRMNQPGLTPAFFDQKLVDAVNTGEVSMERLDDMAIRVLTPYFLLGQDQSFPSIDPATLATTAAHEYGLPRALGLGIPFDIIDGRDVRADHANLIRKLGAAGTVLLKNTNNTLPLPTLKHIAVFGNDAANVVDSGGSHNSHGWDIGTIYIGGGSGTVRLEDPVSPLEAIKERAKRDGSRVKFIANNTAIAAGEFQTIYPLPQVCLVFLKTWASEGQDRTSLENDFDSTAVVNSVASWCTNTVVVTHSGGVNTMPWAHNPNITGILAAHFPGEQSGNSIVDILWGDEVPSGHLPYTIPETEADYDFPILNLTGVTDPNAWQDNYEEGQLIDYRHFDAKNTTPLYEFGFGLSYTTFDMASSLSIRTLKDNPAAVPDTTRPVEIGGHPELWENVLEVEASVSNTGSRAGSAVAQLYMSFPTTGAPDGTPVQVLRGFEKVELQPGETKTVAFEVKRRDVSFWDVGEQNWRLPSGEFVFKAGFSSRDLRAMGPVLLRSK
ncbi:glycoside hydrolase family 3 protein [Melanomma pulvis-pyrius CBS 109.77]|uniref:Probable beta-glucosidase G n=1 Tax=Melanomma pulvis-pyrius CBS 109.77 TaxID=1314802 RepID=A0A6A6XR26_9PLEO|nr:glycoside hydrolase family 3 protein [Melanomma pulvis-pyrius CBS 109.77]